MIKHLLQFPRLFAAGWNPRLAPYLHLDSECGYTVTLGWWPPVVVEGGVAYSPAEAPKDWREKRVDGSTYNAPWYDGDAPCSFFF